MSGAAAVVVVVVDSPFSSSSAHVGVHVFTSVASLFAKPPHLRPRIRIQPNRVTCHLSLHDRNRKKEERKRR